MKRDFIHITDFTTEEIWETMELAKWIKTKFKNREKYYPFDNHTMAMIFAKPSARTRVSFEVGFYKLGGHALFLGPSDIGIGKRESVADIARVLSRYNDMIMARLFNHSHILELAEFADVPVINGLTDFNHPCQIMADIMTFEEHRGSISDKTIAWCGDGNNMATSWIQAATKMGFELRLACPEQLKPDENVLLWATNNGGKIHLTQDPEEAVTGADCVSTDVRDSMGDDQANVRHKLLKPYQVDAALMSKANPDSLFMHCLPAHRGEEVTADVMDGPQSVVWDEAENRLHAQKGILTWCLT